MECDALPRRSADKECAEQVRIGLSCLFADHLKRRLASSGRPPDERPNSTNDVTFAVVLSRLKLGPDKCPSDRSRCEPGPTGYFLWPGSASIGDIEYTAA